MSTDTLPRRARLPYWACCLVASVLMFANYLGALPLMLVVGRLWPHPSSMGEGLVSILVDVVVLLTALLLVGLATRWVLRGHLRDVGLLATRDSWWLFLVGWAVMAVAATGSRLLVVGLGLPHRTEPLDPLAHLTGLPAVVAVVAGITTGVVMQGLPEELLWRGWLLHCLAHRPRLALAVSAIVFGSLHIVSSGGQANVAERLVYLLQAMGFAWLAGALALRLRSLWCAVGVHGGLHLTNLVLGVGPLRTTGPAVWAVEAALCVAAGLLVLRGWTGNRVTYDR